MAYKRTLLLVLVVVLLQAFSAYCSPDRRFIISCDEMVDCSKEPISEMCATDGHTYDNECALKKLNQERSCVDGKFNPIAKIHDGKC